MPFGPLSPRLTPQASAAVLTILFLSLILFRPSGVPAAPPANFTDTSVATGLGQPTDVAFLPNGRILITSQEGALYTSAGSGSAVAYTVPSICSNSERGLLGVAVDPAFTTNSFIYLYYTFNKNNSCASNSASSPVNRVARFTFNTTTNTVNGGSQTVLVDNIPSPNGNHNAGDLGFGKDGLLYVSIGDGGCDLDNSNLCAGQNTNARKENILTGKILRITRDGGIPAGNPFQGAGTAPCAATGRTTQTRCQETFAWGFRNPFRFAFDPNAAGTVLYVNDVGQDTWEEIDNVQAGKDYGWNVREGFCDRGSTTNCGAPPSGMTNPVFAYQHGSCNAITAGAFVPAGTWPAQYDDAYLFSDYTCGLIWQLNGSSRSQFATGPGVISMQFGPSGTTQALYYTTYDNGGQLRKIQYTGQANRPPVARATADKTFGALPLTVTFDGRTSSDPDNDTLSYDWNFGDGSTHGTGPTPQHTYTTKAKRTVTLTVSDGRGDTDTATLTIDAGNTQPQPTILNPTAAAQFSVGQQITLQGNATDGEDGTLPASALKWTVVLHHSTHTHPFLTNVVGNNVQFTAPAPEDLLAASNSYLEIQLTATDGNGLSKTVTQNFQPKKVDLTFATSPSGLTVDVEDSALTGPTTVTSWANWQIQVDVPSPQNDGSGSPFAFSSWSDGGAKAHTITTPSSPQTYTATLAATGFPPFAPVADARVREASPSTNYGRGTSLEVDGGGTPDVESYLRFDVSGIDQPIAKAELWLYATNGSANGPAVYGAPNSWTETGITWANRPARSNLAADDKGAVPSNAWVVYDVTPLVTGNGSFTFVLATTTTDGILANSREATQNKPKLIITPGPPDTSVPTTPQNLRATASASNRVDLSWNAATDNVAVTSYSIYRDGALLKTVGFQTTYVDTTVTNSTTYSYRVRARDSSGNVSPLSATATATTPDLGKTFVAEADARVDNRHPTSHYGTSTQLISRDGGSLDIDSYLRFTVTGVSGAVSKATLRVYLPSGSGYGTADGPAYYTAGNNWSETTINWNNRPPRSTTPRDDKGAIAVKTWVEYDVTPLVAADGTYTFVLSSSSADGVVFSSREGANPPQLVVAYNPSAPATTAQVDEIPTATATPTPTATPEQSTPLATATPTVTLPIADDFETGDLAGWTGIDGLAVQQAIVASGVWAARATSSGSPANPGAPATARRSIGDPEDDLFVRTRFNLLSAGDNPVTLLTLVSRADRPVLSILVTRDGNLAFRLTRTGATTVLRPVTENEWHDLQIHFRSGGNRGLVEIWSDGNLLFSDTARTGTTGIAAVQLGDDATDRAFDVAFDDLGIDTTCIGSCPPSQPEPTEQPTATPSPPTPTQEPTATPSPTSTATPTPEPPTSEPNATAPPEETPTEPPTADSDPGDD
ncbi:MAG TPA: DNRLRE domain-containing protein [Thermomicrobiales bacterium]